MVMVSAITVAYPVIVYFGLQHFSASMVAGVLLLFILARLVFFNGKSAPWVKISLGLASVLLGCSALFNSEAMIRFYPVVINVAMLMVFVWSLFKPPCVIETLARLSDPELPEQAIPYTIKVTKAWCAFFTFNGAVAAFTAMFMSLESWTIYNGFIAYILIGLMFTVEFLIRRKVKARLKAQEQ